MQASNRMYTELLGNATQFVIPVFQRDYNWTEEQCEQLWNDILRVGRNSDEDSDEEHFFGPIVYIETQGQSAAFTRWLLIDGQQRMTTIALLMAAVRDHIKAIPQSSEGLNANKINNDFLMNMYEDGDGRAKLRLRKRDESTLRWLVDGGEEPCLKSHAVEQGYNFFRKKLIDANPVIVHAGVWKLAVVDVRLDRNKDDPQQIFESLNSTGLDLTQADLVRNYVLMGLDESDQTKLYTLYWSKIESLYTSNRHLLDNFLREFVALETEAQKQGRSDQVYPSFRAAFNRCKDDLVELENLLRRLVRFSHYHAAFTMGPGDGTPELIPFASHLKRLREQATTPATLVIKLLDGFERGILDSKSLAEALELIESYLVRRYVCGYQTRSYWQRFAELAYRLKESDCLKSLKVNLDMCPSRYDFPTNREFQSALEQENLYGRHVCRPLLDRLEHADSLEHTDTSKYSIEHIMPQNPNLSSDWQRMLGDDWETVHKTWLHRLGNLTLTAYNRKYSDHSFEQKCEIEHGFRDSPLRLNKDVGNRDQWTKEEIEERGKRLAERALHIWPSLEVPAEWRREAKVDELRAEQGNLQVIREDMDDGARALLDAFHEQTEFLGGITPVVHRKSVSYHNEWSAELICEVLPRTESMLVLFPIDAEEFGACDISVEDARARSYFIGAHQDTHSFVRVHSEEEVNACIPLVRKALAASD